MAEKACEASLVGDGHVMVWCLPQMCGSCCAMQASPWVFGSMVLSRQGINGSSPAGSAETPCCVGAWAS